MQSIKSANLKFHQRVRGISPLTITFVGVLVSRILNSSMLAYMVMGVFFVFTLFKNLEKVRFDSAVVIATSIAVICCCITLISAESPGSNAKLAAKVMCWLLLFYSGYLLADAKGGEQIESSFLQIKDFILLTVLVGFIMQYVFHVQFVTDFDFGVEVPANTIPFAIKLIPNWQDLRMLSVYSHPIVFADLLLFAIVVTTLLDKNRIRKYAFTAVFLVALFLTKTRGAWLTLVLFIALMFFISLWNRRIRWDITALLPIPLALCGVCIVTSGVWDQVIDRLMSLESGIGYTQRSGGIEVVLEMFANDPAHWLFGHGYRASDSVMLGTTIYIEDFNTVDNQWVASLYEFGLIPTFALLCLCTYLLVRFAVCDNPVHVAVAWAGVFLSVCDMFFYNLFTWNVPSFIFFVSLGFLCGSSLGRQSRKGATSKKIAPWASSPSTGY